MNRSIKDILLEAQVSETLTVRGWVRTRRDSKAVSFIELNDGTCLSNLQLVVDESTEGREELARAQTGAAIEVEGAVVESPGKGQRIELHLSRLELVGDTDQEYPLQKKRHTNEYLRTIAHLRPRTNTFGAVFRLRSALSFAVHEFFNKRGFVNVHTPIITASDCEGAGELFTVTTLDLNNVPKLDGAVDHSKDFFGAHTGLTVSGQLEGEVFAQALSKIYTFGPTFRAENSNTSRHLSEFWMIEPEVAFCDLAGNMDLAEDFLKYIINYALENCEEDMAFFDKWIEKGIIDSLRSVAEASFERLSYTDAITALEKATKKFDFPVSWGMDIQTEHERYLTEEFVGRPVFVTDYPKEIKAFYMRLNEDGKTVSAMDLLVPRLGEIIGGAQREERQDQLLERMKAANVPAEDLWWYLELRRFGTTPHAGFGLGFERAVMYLSGIANIRDIIPFPRTPGNAQF